MKTNEKFQDPMWVRLQFIFQNLPIFYSITSMAEFLYASKTITEELRNAKSNQNIWG